MSEIMQMDRRQMMLRSVGAGVTATLAVLPTAFAQSPAPKRNATAAKKANDGPKVALVLGSGSARGFAHIGVIKALEASNFKPDIVVGTSAGALVGALYASGMNGAQMEDLALKVKDIEIVDFATGSKRGMVMGDTLQRYVNMATRNRQIEDLGMELAIVATQLRTGEITVMRRGEIGLAVRASCSVPGVFIPPKIGDIEYVDGALVSPVPVRVARQLGADIVVAVDVSSAPLNATPAGIYEQVMHSFEIMGRSLARLEADQADVIIRPEVGRIPSTDFNARAAFIALGDSAGARFAPVVREKIRDWKTKRGL
ncbi:MAG: patatin-like phospholipase family protein [Betaproteobacteria bacterium]|nr:MAG: patatin-like phospholipase family protein [Betaproteobacteria bacterium]